MTALLELYSRRGAQRFVAIDDADLAVLSQWRWRFHPEGYAVRSVGSGSVLMHRELLGVGPGDERHVDHIDGDRLNNQRSNLRVITEAQNHQNRTTLCKRNRSGYRGVGWMEAKGKWRARAVVEGLEHHLGLFDDPEEAARVASAFRQRHMPFSNETPSRVPGTVDALDKAQREQPVAKRRATVKLKTEPLRDRLNGEKGTNQ